MAPRTACLSPPGSWSSPTPAGTARALLASMLLGVLTDMLGEGMGQSQAPCCPHMSYGCLQWQSETGESCSLRSLLLPFMLGCNP